MAYEAFFGTEGLLRVRFAISPVWETVMAVHAIQHGEAQPTHSGWIGKADGRVGPADLELLFGLHPLSGYTPDFLTPPPQRRLPRVDDDLDQIGDTALELVVDELARCLDDQTDPLARRRIRGMLADPLAARRRIADAIPSCWDSLLRSDWPRIRAILEADISHHADLLAEEGLGVLLGKVLPSARFTDGVLRHASAYSIQRDLSTCGIVLQPSVFVPFPLLLLDAPWQPRVVYPARGSGRLWTDVPGPPPRGLNSLLGGTRATLLANVAEPASTTALARRLGLSPAGVSAHLSVLRDSELVSSRRRGREVLYECTELGRALLQTKDAASVRASPG